MPLVKCPSCQAKYDPGIDGEMKDLPAEVSMKVACPSCGQWLRLPEQEKIDPPNAPAEVLREMRSQSRLVEEGKPTSRRSRDDEYEDEPPRRRRDEDEDDDEHDRPRSHRGYDDARDDYDDRPPRQSYGRPGDGLAIASMIVGILAVVFSLVGWWCCSYFGPVISLIMGVVAVVLGFISRSQGSHSGMGTAGIITGFAAILIAAIPVVLIILGFAWMQANQGAFGPGPGGGAAPPPGNQNRF